MPLPLRWGAFSSCRGGSGSLAFRPGWHLGDIPKATQFDRKNPATGERELFPYDFVWAECEYAMDVDYQEEAMSYGYTENGKFRHSYAGLPRLPVDGYYHYRTNPDPKTVPWVITGAMKVNRILSRSEVDAILAENGVEPTKWQGPDGQQMDAEDVQYSPRDSGYNGQEQKLTKKQYESFGWVRANDVMSAYSYKRLMSAYTSVATKNNYAPQTPEGHFILEAYDVHDYPLYIATISGSVEMPVIHSVYKIDIPSRTVIDYVREMIESVLRDSGTASLGSSGVYAANEMVYVYHREDSSEYSRYVEEHERNAKRGIGKNRFVSYRERLNRTGSTEQSENYDFSLRETSTEELTDEYLANLNPADMDTEADRLFLQRYQTRRKAYTVRIARCLFDQKALNAAGQQCAQSFQQTQKSTGVSRCFFICATSTMISLPPRRVRGRM